MVNKKIAVFATLLCVGCAPFGTDSNLERRVDEQDLQLRQLQPRQTDTENEVQAMRQEIAQLKGQLAQMNRNAQGLPADSPATGMPPGTAMTITQGYETPAGITPQPGNAPDSSAYSTTRATATAAPQGSYGLPADTPVEPVAAPTGENWGKADPQPEPQAPAAKKDISLALFDAGMNDFQARKYPEAERSFSDFLKNYPNHTQAAAAQYYLAECQFQRNRFPEAALAYDTVIKKYPKTSQGRQAMYKQAIAFSKMKQPAAAKARMQELISKYPSSAEATRAKAFLKTNK